MWRKVVSYVTAIEWFYASWHSIQMLHGSIKFLIGNFECLSQLRMRVDVSISDNRFCMQSNIDEE